MKVRDLAVQWLSALVFVLVFVLAAETTMAVRYSREMSAYPHPQQSPAAGGSFTPSKIQLLELQVRQKDAMIAQRDFAAAQQRFQAAINELNAKANEVKKENGWPADLLFNGDSLAFSEAPKPAKPPEPAKK